MCQRHGILPNRCPDAQTPQSGIRAFTGSSCLRRGRRAAVCRSLPIGPRVFDMTPPAPLLAIPDALPAGRGGRGGGCAWGRRDSNPRTPRRQDPLCAILSPASPKSRRAFFGQARLLPRGGWIAGRFNDSAAPADPQAAWRRHAACAGARSGTGNPAAPWRRPPPPCRRRSSWQPPAGSGAGAWEGAGPRAGAMRPPNDLSGAPAGGSRGAAVDLGMGRPHGVGRDMVVGCAPALYRMLAGRYTDGAGAAWLVRPCGRAKPGRSGARGSGAGRGRLAWPICPGNLRARELKMCRPEAGLPIAVPPAGSGAGPCSCRGAFGYHLGLAAATDTRRGAPPPADHAGASHFQPV